ncbi:hypothetical protein B0H19DRAFT_285331 [Mycena capillaripes]|nr:hypothetical protein B0H19DRAFT_285331 [Mycena capillaripes]
MVTEWTQCRARATLRTSSPESQKLPSAASSVNCSMMAVLMVRKEILRRSAVNPARFADDWRLDPNRALDLSKWKENRHRLGESPNAGITRPRDASPSAPVSMQTRPGCASGDPPTDKDLLRHWFHSTSTFRW